MSQRIVSPCVGLCSTAVGDSVCRGCQRHDDEIRDWLLLDARERGTRMNELDRLRERIAGQFLCVEDADKLNVQLQRHRIRHREGQPALSRAVELLRVGREQMRDLTCYGLAPTATGAGQSPARLYASLSKALLDAAQERQQAEECQKELRQRSDNPAQRIQR